MNNVCPDRELLSVYLDGELPSPWKEKMEAHIAGCPRCAQALEAYRRVVLPSVDAAELVAAEERVWQKLEQGAGAAVSYSPVWRARPVWRRRISVPLPAAAAAVLLIAFAFVFAFRTMGTTDNSAITFASETEFEMPGIIPISDMENVLQYLDNSDNGDIIILRLPESRSFVNYGEPAIFNAADYSRQVSTRQVSGRQGWRR